MLKRGCSLVKKLGIPRGSNNFAFGPVLVELGDVDASLEVQNSTLELSELANFAAGVVGSYMLQSWIYAMFGDLQTSSQIQHRISTFMESYDSYRPMYLISRALHKMFSGSLDEALMLFEEVGRQYGFESELLFRSYIFTLHVEIYLSKGDYELAVRTAGDYLKS